MKHKSTLKRVLHYIAGYRLYLAASLLLAVLTVALTLYAPVLTGDAIDYMIGEGRVDFGALGRLLVQLGVVIGATSLFQWLMNLCNNHMTYKVVMDVRTEAFDHMQDLPLSYIDSHPQGDIVSRLVADIDQFSDGLLMGFTQLFTGVMTILGTLLFMLFHWPCAASLLTIRKETGSWRWTLLAAVLPAAAGLLLCFFTAQGAKILGLA